ncbi:MAG: hypothetical protein ACRD4R_09100 [Candidatus Acidiferrales bacterium]
MKAPRPKTAAPLAQAAPAVSHHDRHCTICSHRDRVDIETEFVNWHSTHHIAYDYKISRSAIYRHAHALGLIAQRNRRLRSALAHLIECAEDVEPTADSIVRAIHAFARINDDGQWVEPPSHVIVSSGGVLSAPPRAGVQGGIRRESGAPNAHRPLAISLDAPMLANVIDVPSGAVLPGTPNRVESDATR